MKRLDKDKKPKVKIPEGKKTKSTETRKAQGQNKDEAVNKEDVTEKTSRGKLATEKVVKERSKSLDHKDKKPKVKIPEGKKTKSTETRKAQGQNKDEAVNKEDVTEKTSRGKLATEKVVKERSNHWIVSKIVKQERNTVRSTGKVPAAKSSDVKRISRPNQSTGFQDENTANASIQTRTHARKDTTIADSKRKSSQKPERRTRPQK